MSIRARLLVPVIISLVSVAGFAADPPWVLLERGKVAFEERDLTTALDRLLEAVEADNAYPEAEYWLGRVYEAQGQAILAEEQYRRAIDLSIYLRVPDDVIEYRYSLALLLLGRGSPRQLEAEAMLHALADEEGASRPATISMEHQYMEILTGTGPDELLYLYREELTWSLRARRLLGEMAWNDSRYRTSLLESTRVVMSMLSTAAEAYRGRYPEWRFDIDAEADRAQPDRDVRYSGGADGTIYLVDSVLNEMPDVAAWLSDEGFWSQVYLLAASLYAEGYGETARSVWTILVDEDPLTGTYSGRSEAGTWGRLAARQLEEPFITKGSLSP